MNKIKIHVFHTGNVRVSPYLPFGGEHCNILKASGIFIPKKKWLTLPVSCYLIEHPNGLILFDTKNQKVFAGGSGCACCALTSYSYILDKMHKKELKRVLIIATGALLSPTLIQQKETIPCIAHAVSLEVCE